MNLKSKAVGLVLSIVVLVVVLLPNLIGAGASKWVAVIAAALLVVRELMRSGAAATKAKRR